MQNTADGSHNPLDQEEIGFVAGEDRLREIPARKDLLFPGPRIVALSVPRASIGQPVIGSISQ